MLILQFVVAISVSLNVVISAEESTGTPFTCNVVKSTTVPTSVHKLRPSDINVIAGIGDSLTAGMGIYSSNLINIFLNYRGSSFTMGGKVNLEQHTTLPNILKKFNRFVTGYSTGVGGPDNANAHLNVAVVGERAEGMPSQARKIVKRMKDTLGSTYNTDWKIINVFVGANDECDYCKFPDRFKPQNFIRHLKEALDYLHKNVPRAFVNLIVPVDATAVADIQELSLKCKLLFRTFWCVCPATRPRDEVVKYARTIQNLTVALFESGLYDTRDDFTVVLQPFFRNTYPPVTPHGFVDLSYLAPDCFHFRAKTHAAAAVNLWNNMLQPVGQKTEKIVWTNMRKLSCPTEKNPYLFTRLNSVDST